jgi:thiamine-phosphate pyrophosphorylase
MADRCLLYYITDRSQFPGDESSRHRMLLDKIAEAARAGVEYIQLREKDLRARELETLALEAAHVIQQLRTDNRIGRTRLLVNSRTDVALAAGADGVHLRSDDIPASHVRSIWREVRAQRSLPVVHGPLIAVSCHTSSDVLRAESEGADFAVLAPIFEKKEAPETQPKGVAELREACAAKIPVLALGGVTLANAASCLAAGGAGIAGIRLFQENRVEEVVRALRRI